MRISHKSINSTRGAVALELALMLPFLVALVIVTVNLGLLFREHQILQNAAREGARLSALYQNQVGPAHPAVTLATIKDGVIHYAAQENVTIAAGNITVRQDYPIAIVGGVTDFGSEVIISYPRALLIPGAPLLPSGPVTLTARSVFRNLY